MIILGGLHHMIEFPKNQNFLCTRWAIKLCASATIVVWADILFGGWISGYKDIGEVIDYGFGGVGFDIDAQKIITIADKDGKIVGIYPGASIKNIYYILRNHRNLVSDDDFEGCSDLLPERWNIFTSLFYRF